MTAELAQIVGYVDQLAEVDTDGIEPMAHAIELANVFRDDALSKACRATRLWRTPRTTTTGAIWCRPCWANSS